MITAILASLVLILAGILGFIMVMMQYEYKRRKREREKRTTKAWKTVFERTDLRA